MRGDDAIDYPEHLARDHRTAGEEKTQQVWKAEHPLAHRLMGKYLIYQKGCAFGHAARAATGAESTTLTTERNQALLVAGFTAHAQKTVFEPPALQVVFEFPLHIVRQYPAVLGQLLPEHRVVPRYQLIEECLLGPMALIVKSTGVRAGIPCRNNGGHDSRPCDSD